MLPATLRYQGESMNTRTKAWAAQVLRSSWVGPGDNVCNLPMRIASAVANFLSWNAISLAACETASGSAVRHNKRSDA